jgi:hypothetical protein
LISSSRTFRVTIWADVVNDTLRAHQYVDEGRATVAYAVCIDEGNYIAKRDLSGVATVLEVSQLRHGAFVIKAPMMLSPVLTLWPRILHIRNTDMTHPLDP